MIQKFGVVHENMKKIHKAVALNDNVLLVLDMLEKNTFTKTDDVQYKYVDLQTETMVMADKMNDTQLTEYLQNVEITYAFKRLAHDYADIILVKTAEENDEWIYSSDTLYTREQVLLSYHRRIIMILNDVMLKKKYLSKDNMASMNHMNAFTNDIFKDIRKEIRRKSVMPRGTTRQAQRNTQPRQNNTYGRSI